jgi:hypothetical protein
MVRISDAGRFGTRIHRHRWAMPARAQEHRDAATPTAAMTESQNAAANHQ